MSLSATKSSGVVQGRYYRARYRAINAIGSGAFSTTAYILAASIPATMQVTGTGTQIYTSITASDLVITWGLPHNGGSEILEGQILIRQSDAATFTEE